MRRTNGLIQDFQCPNWDISSRRNSAANFLALVINELGDLRQAIAVTQAIYQRSVFPSMKVGWGTYANQIGHIVSTGCFRCHDEEHKTTDGRAISQDCELCHTIE